MNEQTLQGHWNEIKGGVKKKWGQITDDDLRMAQGDVDRLVGTIQRKTGEGRDAIMKFLEETAGVAVTFSDRENFFDGRSVSKQSNAGISIPARGKVTLSTRWCSSTASGHTAQSNFSGTDANGHVIRANGPQVTLQ